jgi:hypothetical protein
VLSEFYTANRRRDNRGSQANPIGMYGEGKFTIDLLGGWRENVHSVYAGRKTTNGKRRKIERLQNQLIVDVVRAMKDRGLKDDVACRAAPEILNRIDIEEDGGLVLVSRDGQSVEQITDIWTRRGCLGIKPTHNRYVIPAMVAEIKKWSAPSPNAIDVRSIGSTEVQGGSRMLTAPRSMTKLGLAFLKGT